MNSIVILASDSQAAAHTIEEIKLTASKHLIAEILVVDELGVGLQVPAQVVSAPGQHKHSLCNHAASMARGDNLVFLSTPCKPKPGWLDRLIAPVLDDDKTITGPRLVGLDPNLWSLTNDNFDTLAFDWALRQHNSIGGPLLHNGCCAVNRAWFQRLGGFDCGLSSGHLAELCIKNWLCGGTVAVVPTATVGYNCVAEQIDDHSGSRIAELWMASAARHFYQNRGIQPDSGGSKYAATHRLQQDLQEHSFDWLVERFMPELGIVQKLRNSATGKSLAIVCDGPSLEQISRWDIYKHDLTVALDYVPTIFQCDYVISNQKDAVRSVLGVNRYQYGQFLLPKYLHDGVTAIAARDLVPGCVIYPVLEAQAPNLTVEPPFVNFGHSLHFALQLAAFMGVKQITLYGWDGRIVEGRTHTGLIPHYKSGYYWPNDEQTAQLFAHYNKGLSDLVRMLYSRGVTVLKHSYA